MAISAGAAGAWAAANATTQTVTLPTHSAGQMLLVIVGAKSASIASVNQTTSTSGWTRIASAVDGSVNSGNGTGSVSQAIFYKIATSSSETNPVIAFATTATPSIAVAQSYSKGGGEVWLTPVVVQAATTNATSISVTMPSNPGITAGDWGVIAHTTRDDSALTVPTWTATGTTLAAVVEYPATAIASGTSDDMAGDSAYRSVTSGTASAAPVVTGTQAAAETGMTCFIRLRVEAANPQTVTPTTASLTLTTFASTVTATQVTLVTPSTASLTSATFAPTVTASDHKTVTPTTASTTTATFAPVIALAVTPAILETTTATFAPTVTATDHQIATPATASLATESFAPTVLTPVLVTPDVLALTVTALEPTVTATDHKTVTPAIAALALTTFEPDVEAFQGLTLVPASADLALSTFAPSIVLTENQLVTPSGAVLALTAFAPGVIHPQTFTPATATLALAGFIPVVRVTGPITFIDGDLVVGPSVSGSVSSPRLRARLTVTAPGIRADLDVDS